ncbi:MAG: Lpg1974 family pore-forming outer membrane protein [Waddliaceae bacterium]
MKKFFLKFFLGITILNTNALFSEEDSFCQDCYEYRSKCRSTPCVSICCPPHCGELFIAAEYLYWKAQEDGLSYALTGLGTFGGTPPTIQGKVEDVDWKWNSGYRIGGGFVFPCQCWDLFANYTHLNSDAKGFTEVPGTGFDSSLWTTFGPPANGSAILAPIASAQWDLRFRVVDVEAGRRFCWKNCYIFRPFGGIQVVWTKDAYDIVYSSPPDNYMQTIHQKQDFCAVGPRLGISNNWNVFRCFSFFADGAASLVWGDFKVKRLDTLGVVDPTTVVDTKHNFHSLRPLLDFKAGIMINGCFFNRVTAYAKVAYETFLVLQHNQMLKFVDNANLKGVFFPINSNLVFHGLTVSAGIKF